MNTRNKYKSYDKNLRQKLLERKALDKIRPTQKIQGINPNDRNARGIIPIAQPVYAPAGGFRNLRKALLHEDDTGLLKGDDE